VTVTKAEFTAMSWHQRQRLNAHLRAETARLTAELKRLNTPRAKVLFDVERTLTEARRMLAALPADPNAAAHRVELDRELANRTTPGSPATTTPAPTPGHHRKDPA